MSLTIGTANTMVPFDLWRPGVKLAGNLIAFDTETSKVVVGQVPRLVIATATDGQQGCFIARQHVGQFFAEHTAATWLMHNAAFDLAVIDQVGVNTGVLVDRCTIYDTGLLYQLVKLADRGDCHGRWALDHVTKELLAVELSKDVKSADGQDVRLTFGRFLQPAGTPDYPELLKPEHRPYLKYAAADPLATWLVGQALNDQARRLFSAGVLDIYNPSTYASVGPVDGINVADAWLQHGFLTHHVQLKAAIALAAIERRGMKLDADMIKPTIAEIDKEIARILGDLVRLGWQPGTGSSTKFQQLLAEEERRLGKKLPRTSNGNYSCSSDMLADVAPLSELIALYLEYQNLNKISKVFLTPLDNTDRTAHGHFNVLVNTGRTSCSGYRDEDGTRLGLNLQNLPRGGHIRECFVPSPGHLFLACDYSGIELCTLAEHTLTKFGQSAMAGALQRGADLHCAYAARRAGIDMNAVPDWSKATLMPLLGPNAKQLRQAAKAANFGYPGGLGAKTFVEYAKTTYGVQLTEEQARQEKGAWLAQWPGNGDASGR